MTQDQYFNDHLPHRVNLMTTFRDRYSGRPSARVTATRPAQQWDQPRDFFRCSKDISLLMARFFCDEMGLGLKEGATELHQKKQPRFDCKRLTLADAKQDARYNSLVAVLKAANRAVAHIDDFDVNHGFGSQADHDPLFEVIDWIENLIESHLYAPNNRSLNASMQLPNNVL